MSKNWYPMINYDECTECGACVEKCSRGVYNKEKAPRPVVVYPEGCLEGCTGCSSLCPSGAIEYFGDDAHTSVEGCGCGCEADGECEEGCGCGCDDAAETDDCGCGKGCCCGGE